MIRQTLGIERETCELSYGLTFPAERRLTIAGAILPQFARNRDEPGNAESIRNVLRDAIESSPGNVVIFFQSSAEARRYYRMFEKEASCFLDEAGVSSQEVRQAFFRVGENGGKGVLFTYLWGTLSEGVDFRDDRSRVAIVVGVGYPALNDRLHAVESAYDHEFGFGTGWEYAVQVPTIRKIRQAMGRVVRSPSDYGVRILLDGRYLTDSVRRWPKYSVYRYFPEEERTEIVDVEPEKVKYSLLNFFQDLEHS
jgi:DNA excision repair protein ERCC-2